MACFYYHQESGLEVSCYSEKTGKTYDAVTVLDDTGGTYVNFKLEFLA